MCRDDDNGDGTDGGGGEWKWPINYCHQCHIVQPRRNCIQSGIQVITRAVVSKDH